MTGPRQNEYFIPGDGISREVIQADICRYLGNDALVRPGNHNGCNGYFIRGYRNLTSEMIADLKADSARWEADAVRRTNQGHPRGSYYHHDYHMHDYHHMPSSQSHNMHPSSLPQSSYSQQAPIHEPRIHEPRQSQPPGHSPPPSYSAPPSSQPSYIDSYPSQPQYGTSQTPPFSSPSYSTSSSYTVPHSHSPFQAGQSPYTPQTPPFTNAAQPAVSADVPPTYKYQNSGYGFEGSGNGGGWNNAPRTYPGGGYESEQDYSPVTTGSGYPATTASDHRIPPKPSMSSMNGMNGMSGMNGVPGMSGLPPMSGMDGRYPPDSTFADRNRQQPPRDNRRPR